MKKSVKKGVTRRRKRQLALLTFVVLVASVVAVLFLTPLFNVTKIEVRGTMILKEDNIVRDSGILSGDNIFNIDLDTVEENILAAEGRISKVTAKRSLPDTIVINVVEEIGVACLKAESGYVIITADGRCIEVTEATTVSGSGAKVVEAPNYPKIVGMKNVKYQVGKNISSEDKQQMEALLLCLKEFAKQGYISDIIEIDVTDIGEIKFYYQSKNLCVEVGDTDKLDYKMECFGPIYKDYILGKTKEGEMPSGYVDLSRSDRPTYSPKKSAQSEEQNNKKTQ